MSSGFAAVDFPFLGYFFFEVSFSSAIDSLPGAFHKTPVVLRVVSSNSSAWKFEHTGDLALSKCMKDHEVAVMLLNFHLRYSLF